MSHAHGYFPEDLEPDEHGLVCIGGELGVPIVLEAYSRGIFPWTGEHPIPWFSPDPRLILQPQDFRRSRSLRAEIRRGTYQVRFDHDFSGVMLRCAATPRDGQDGTWITENMLETYGELHRLGFAHCVESYRDGELLGGLYGLSLGRAFFGESMFHHAPNASKVAIEALCTALVARGFHLIDCQQETPHLMSLGAFSVSRREFLARLARALGHTTARGSWASWAPEAAPGA